MKRSFPVITNRYCHTGQCTCTHTSQIARVLANEFVLVKVTVISVVCIQLVTECNDGARRMERTEQLHNIHKQLDFGKLKVYTMSTR